MDGQSGIDTSEDGGKAQENKAYSMHRFQNQEAWHMQGYMGKTPVVKRQMIEGSQPILEFYRRDKVGQEK